jgi:tetratricopeptide (TPR) repeat protein
MLKRIVLKVIFVLVLFRFVYSVDFWSFKPFVGSVFNGPLEEKLFYEYKNTGKISDLASFVILASGVQENKVGYYKNIINNVALDISNGLKDKKLSRYDTAKYVFDYLHKNVFKSYKLDAVRISDVLDRGDYNCASSTGVYNVFLYSFGFQPKVIILPDHVFTVFYIDSYKVEVETTTKYGFDVVRNPEGLKEFARLTSFSYVPEGKGKRIESGDEGLISVLYADQVLIYKDIKNYEEILKASIKALMLMPNLNVAYTNLRSAYIGLLGEYNDLRDFDTMVKIAKEALTIFPNDSDIEDSIEVAYYNSVFLRISQGDFPGAFQRIVYIKNNDSTYYDKVKDLVGLLIQQWGVSYISKEDYEGVFNVINKGLMIDTNKTYYASVNLSYEATKKLLANSKYDLAVMFHKKLIEIFPTGKELINNLGYVYNVWGVSLMNDGNLEDASFVFDRALKDLPNDSSLKQNASIVYAKLAVRMFEKKQYDIAISNISRAYELNPSRNLDDVRLKIYIEWVRFLALTEENFVLAKKVCDEALKIYPKDFELLKLHNYIVNKLK